jgi:hypothetical protein
MKISLLMKKAFNLSFLIIVGYSLFGLLLVVLHLVSVFNILAILGLLIILVCGSIGLVNLVLWLFFKEVVTKISCENSMNNKNDSMG